MADRYQLQSIGSGRPTSIHELRDGFRQGFVFELIDIRGSKTLQTHVFVLNPVKYNLSEPFQSTLTPADDNTVVAEENGIIIREITLEGTFGLTEKRARGFHGAQYGGSPATGTSHFLDLRRLFRRYSDLKKDPSSAASIQLVFHALRDDDHFLVVPREFVTPRDAGKTRAHYEYRITMAAIAEGSFGNLAPKTDLASFGDRFTNTMQAISEAFNDGRAAIAEITANISQIRRKIGNINSILNNAIQVVNAVGGFLAGVTSIINYPLQLLASVAEGVARAADTLAEAVGASTSILWENARSLRRLEAAIDQIAMFDDKFADVAADVHRFFAGERATRVVDTRGTDLGSAPGPGGATVGTRTRAVAGSAGREAGLALPRGTGFRGVPVRRTDSLESIAAAAGTTPETLLVINELQPPYLAPGGGPGVLQPGDIILVPDVSGSGGGDPRGANDYLTAAEALYGVDIALDPYELAQGRFEIRVNETSNPYDFELVRGVASVVQGTEITLGTRVGATAFLPSIGIRDSVGTKGTLQNVLLASITLRQALLQDPRVERIESMSVEYDGNTGALTQEVTPILKGSKTGATLVLPFGRASGGGG